MAKLILRRLHQWPDIRQSYEIHLDGTPVASIGSGKTVEIEVAPGLHEITATMGPFLSSQPVRLDIAPEGDHRVEVGTFLRNPPLLAIGLTSMAWLFLATIVVLGAPFANLAARFFWPGGLFLGTLLLGLSPLVARVACATRWRDRYLYIRPIAPAASTVPKRRAGSGWRPRLSVRGLMVAVLVLGGLLGLHLHRARLQREAVSAIKRAGGSVRYHWEPEGRLVGRPVNPTWWESTMARLGPDHFGRVVWVGFNGSPIGEPDDGVMAHIARLEDLEELDFSPASHPSVSDAGLAYLRGLPRLRRLNLSRTGVRGPGLAHLRGMNQLKRLELLELPLKDEDLIHLGGITSLEVLTLSSGGITDDGLAHLSGLKLRQLRLESPWISGAGLRHVGGMTDLMVPGAQFPQAGFPASPGALNRAEVGRSGRDGGGGRRHGDPGTIERALPSRLIAYPGWRRWLGLPRGPLKARTSQFVRHSRHRYGPGLTGRLEQLSISLSARDRSHRPWRRTTLGQVSWNSSFLSPDGRKAWIMNEALQAP